MFEASCHCEKVIVAFPKLPESLTQCNCSLCYRYGALWGYFEPDEIELFLNGEVIAYRQGEGTLDAFHCRKCGCLTHYVTNDSTERDVVGINFRMVKREVTENIRIRNFDGANTWKFLDN